MIKPDEMFELETTPFSVKMSKVVLDQIDHSFINIAHYVS